jgi:hypothetical protein
MEIICARKQRSYRFSGREFDAKIQVGEEHMPNNQTIKPFFPSD